jgi:hypothetical protein
VIFKFAKLDTDPAFAALIKHHLIPSGAYNQLVSENNQLDSLLFKVSCPEIALQQTIQHDRKKG